MFAVLEEMTPPQGGPPPHVNHREDEVFCVLEGELQFMVGDRSVTATAGSVLHVPHGIPHTFKNVGTTPSRMLIFVTPGGLEKFFEEVGVPTASAPTAPPFTEAELQKILAAFPRYGVEVLAPQGDAHA